MQALGGRGEGPGPSQNSPFPTRDSFKGAGPSWDAQRPVTVVGVVEACTEGASRAVGGGSGGLAGWRGPGCGSGDPFVAGRLRRAPRMEHCGCDVGVQGRSRRSACHLPRP